MQIRLLLQAFHYSEAFDWNSIKNTSPVLRMSLLSVVNNIFLNETFQGWVFFLVGVIALFQPYLSRKIFPLEGIQAHRSQAEFFC